MALFSGDWLWNDDRRAYDEAYEGEFLYAWSGGVEFTATLEVAREIVARQNALVEDDPAGFDRLEIREDGTIVVTTPAAILGAEEDATTEYPPINGRAHISFGWTWGQLEEDEDGVEHVDAETRIVRA